MNLIAAVSSDWGIGYKNELLFRIDEDLRRFRKLTLNKVVVMGHNTFKSLPNGKPLPDRTNIVLSRNSSLKIPDAIVCGSEEILDKILKNYEQRDIFIIGGGKIYELMLNRCRLAYITKVEANPAADVYMNNLDKLSNWRLIEESLPKFHGETAYKYSVYTNSLFE